MQPNQAYQAVREAVGIWERQSLGFLTIVGPDRLSWLQGMVSQDVRLLTPQRPRLPACILNATGHLLADLVLLFVSGNHALTTALGFPSEDWVLLELPAMTTTAIATILDQLLIMEEVEIRDVSGQVHSLTLQGPQAAALWQANARAEVLATEADHTGSGGVDLFLTTGWETLLETLQQAGAILISPEIQEILRVEAGIPKYGADLEESVIPLEAHLGPTHISLTKGCYVGQEIIARIDSRGHTNRALTGLRVRGERLPQVGERLFVPTPEGETARETGRITSVLAASPVCEGQPIALGYVRHEHRTPGTLLQSAGPDSLPTLLEVVELPFYRGQK